MALQTFVGSLTSPSTTGDQAITGLGFKPIAVLLFCTETTADGTGSIYKTCFGIAANGSNVNRVFSTRSGDGVSLRRWVPVAGGRETQRAPRDGALVVLVESREGLVLGRGRHAL